MTKMNGLVMPLWINALRSGEFSQGRYVLRDWARDNGFNYGSLSNIIKNKTKKRYGKNKQIKSIKKLS